MNSPKFRYHPWITIAIGAAAATAIGNEVVPGDLSPLEVVAISIIAAVLFWSGSRPSR
jgi:hypothetical protein